MLSTVFVLLSTAALIGAINLFERGSSPTKRTVITFGLSLAAIMFIL